ncbi:MAG: FecR domain-containing protein [Cyclobacteriaceae bacterium]
MNELLAKYFSGNATTDERTEVEAWRNQSNENASEFLEASDIWHQQTKGQEFDVASALSKVKQQMQNEEAKVVSMKENIATSESSSFGFMKYAAGIALVIGLGLIYWLTSVPGIAPSATYATLDDEVQDVELSDGTIVTLDENSQLIVLEGFNGEDRSVKLTGTAFFDVARDENRPFIIDAGNSEVKVLGTSFLVKSDEAAEVTEVIVKSGSVALAADYGRTNPSVVLSPGEIGVADSRKAGVLKRNNKDANYLAWKDKVITFDRTTLTEVAQVLNDVYKVEMTFEGNIGNCQMTAQFQQQSIEAVVEIISQTFGFEVKHKGKGYKFTGNGC